MLSTKASAGAATTVRCRPTIARILTIVAIPTVIFLVYAETLSVPFYFDDTTSILTNPTIHSVRPVSAVLVGTRPLLNASYALTYQLSGRAAWGHHLGNIVLHSANALLVYVWVWLTLEMPRFRCRRPPAHWVALAAGLLFAVHPLPTEVVTYISGRTESLAAGFVLTALVCLALALRAEHRGQRADAARAGAVLAVVAGLLSKESAAVTPLLLLAYESTVDTHPVRRILRRHWVMYAGLAATWLIPAWMVMRHPEYANTVGFGFARSEHGIPPLQYAYTQAGVVLHYLRLVWMPLDQVFDYDWPLATSALSWTVILPAAALLMLAAGAVALWRRQPLYAFGVLWFFVALAPTSSIVPLADVAAERRMYLPLVGMVLIGVVALASVRVDGRRRDISSVPILLCCMAFVGCAALAWRRNAVWQDPVALWRDTVAKAPGNPRAHVNLGVRYWQRGDLQQARTELETAQALVQRGQSPQAIPRHATFAATHLAQVYLELGNVDAATAAYQAAMNGGAASYAELRALLQRVERELERAARR